MGAVAEIRVVKINLSPFYNHQLLVILYEQLIWVGLLELMPKLGGSLLIS